uniref:Splicing factor Cactin n=2 Tax=Hordeum vulgare subsp. vulgare TaxID=112509 RepID=E5F4N2_HORVV|nr:unknown [Hordeum vulgare subsp. vulgare]
MAKPSAASPAREIARPSSSLSKAARRRAGAVSQKLAARGLGAFVWHKKLDRDLARGLLPDIVSLRSERRRCLARRKEAAADRVAGQGGGGGEGGRLPPRAEQAPGRDAVRLRAPQAHRRARQVARRDAAPRRRGASLEDLRQLGKEIDQHAVIDRANGPFWEAAKVMCDDEIARAAGTAGHGERLLHAAILADVRVVVEGKSIEEFEAMQETVAARMAAGKAMVVEHWQGVTELIRVEKARKYLQQNYSTCDDDEAPPSSDDKDDGPESADDTADADGEEGSEALCPVALPQTPPGPEQRKPKYITRVRSGFEWNKYNRVHYDHDQPPPKIVKGYKFVVHYPDLAGTKPPEYTIHEDGDSGETCIIKFHAGPPYEDVAFRIVNKEWEYSRKAGFRCTFERGILHLNFNFKRFFYKR